MLVVISAHPAFAQDHPHPDDAGQLRVEPVIVITSPGPARAADELIGSASVLDRNQLVDSLQGSLGDTLDRLPGVASTHFGAAAGRPVLRGLGAERVLVLTNGIGVIDASAASPDHQVAADGIDAERIEVLRGPAALAYGGQAIGGVVNVVDGLIAEGVPDRMVSGQVYGAHNSVSEGLEGAVKAQVSAGPLVVTAMGSARDQADYAVRGFAESSRLRALEGAELSGVEGHVPNSAVTTASSAVGVSLVGDRGFLGAAVRRQTSDYGLPGELGEDGTGGPYIDLAQTRVDVRGGFRFDAGPIDGVNGSFSSGDYEHTEFEAPGEPGTVYTSQGEEGRVELDHSLAGFSGSAGLQYVDRSFGASGDEALITPTDTTGLGVFVYETREWDGGLGVEGGLRWDTITHDNIDAGKASFDTMSGALGVHQHWEDGLFIGSQLSVTQRAPNETELFANGPHLATSQFEVGDAGLSPETGINLEGIARLTREEWSLSLSLFATRFNDFIYLAPSTVEVDGLVADVVDGLPVFRFSQQDADLRGGELEAEYFLHEVLGADWRLAGNASLVDAELANGDPVPYVPPVTLNAQADAFVGPWTLGGAVTWAARQDRPGVGDLPTDGYVLVDLSLRYDLSTLGLGREGSRLFVDVQNIADEEARPATSVIKDIAPLPGRNIRMGFALAL